MNLVDVSPFDELVLLINALSDEKSKRILLSKAAEVYGYGGKAHIIALTSVATHLYLGKKFFQYMPPYVMIKENGGDSYGKT